MKNTRRELLKSAAAGVCVLSFRPPAHAAGSLKELRFGMCADVHQDVMHDASERLGSFLKAMAEKEAHFVAQMGDFCQPKSANDSFREVWHSWEGDQYDVIGNHDMDGGKTREQFREYVGMEEGYYTFMQRGYRFIVLDGNDRHDGAPAGYPRHIGEEQRAWLTETLSETTEPVIIFSHQSLENASGVDNGADVRAILEAANEEAGWGRVLVCFSGHHHLDDLVDQRKVHAAGNGAFANTLNQKLLWLNQLLREEKLVENGAVGIREDTLDVRVLGFEKSPGP